MRNKTYNKFSFFRPPYLIGGFLSLLLIVGVTLSGSSLLAGDESMQVSVEEAKRRITTQEGLDSIPKNVWKKLLTPEEYKIMWRKGTEKPFTGELLKNTQAGVYVTAGCGIPVFHSKHKFKSGTGWPSFWDVFDEVNIQLKDDRSWGMTRTEILSSCGEHLGHVFDDGPEPTGLRYCINSVALKFIPLAEFEKQANEKKSKND